MRLVRINEDFELYEYESKSEIEEYIKVNQGILINDKCEDIKKFYEIRVNSDEPVVIGVFGGGHGIEPSTVKVNDGMLISIDEKVHYLDLKTLSLRWVIDLDSIVYKVVKSPNTSYIIICELGVVSITEDGARLWEHICDLITDYKFDNDTLRLSTDEGVYSLFLDNGNVI